MFLNREGRLEEFVLKEKMAEPPVTLCRTPTETVADTGLDQSSRCFGDNPQIEKCTYWWCRWETELFAVAADRCCRRNVAVHRRCCGKDCVGLLSLMTDIFDDIVERAGTHGDQAISMACLIQKMFSCGLIRLRSIEDNYNRIGQSLCDALSQYVIGISVADNGK